MKASFPGYFRPTAGEFATLWTGCLFAVDANVLLNLYRYSQSTREELEKTLDSVRDRLFMPHQAAREFLRNRLSVTAGQAEEYAKATKTIRGLKDLLADKKRHPFLPDEQLQKFTTLVEELCSHLDEQKVALLNRLAEDEILDFVEQTFAGKIGESFDDEALRKLAHEGESRYQSEVPPGYRDGKKDGGGDTPRKYGDLVVWKQLIKKAKETARPLVFVTDDKKDDWWLEQSGRTIGPRPELVEEFSKLTGQRFWMYSVDKFIEEAARAGNVAINVAAIAEIIEAREVAKSDAESEAHGPLLGKGPHPVLTEDELLHELRTFLDSHPSQDGSVGIRYFVVNYLGSQNYEINHSYARLNSLAARGEVELFKRDRNGVAVTCIRLPSASTTGAGA